MRPTSHSVLAVSAVSLASIAPLAALAASAALSGCTASGQTRLPDNASYDAGSTTTVSCLPNLDGQIDARELRPATGIAATYLVSPPGTTRSVDVVGQVDASGKRVWDWSAGASQDLFASLTATPLAGLWFASFFPTGQIATPIDAAGTIDGIYTYDDHAFSLLGIASVEENPKEGKTLLVYDQPVAVFQFPIRPGAAWTSVGDAKNALIHGLPDATHDTYDVKVDAAGTLVLPEFTLSQVMRVRTTTTVKPSVGVTTTTRQVSFLFECFGEVARATSQTDEANDDFTTAAETRRLGSTPE